MPITEQPLKPRVMLQAGDEVFHRTCGRWHAVYRNAPEQEDLCKTHRMFRMRCYGDLYYGGHDRTPPAGRA